MNHARLNSRKTGLLVVISAAIALLVMTVFYIHFQPKSDVELSFEPLGETNSKALGNEFRVWYVMVDDVYISLGAYISGVPAWSYDGTLVAYGECEPIKFTVQASRVVEVSMKKGTWMGKGIVGVGSERKEYDFYQNDDDGQEVIRISLIHFLNFRTGLIGFAVFCFLFALLFRFVKMDCEYWLKPLSFTDTLVCTTLFFAAVMFCMERNASIGTKPIYYTADISAYIAQGKRLLHGFTPYLESYEEKGPIVILLSALGGLLWFPYGIWILSTTLFFTGLIFLYLAMRLLFSRYTSLVAVICAVAMCKAYNYDGINTEILSIPFINTSFYIFMRYFIKREISHKWLIICGMCFSLVLLQRMSNAWLWVVGVPMVLYLSVRERRYADGIKKMLLMGGGAGIVAAPIVIWLAANGAVGAWITDTVLYFSKYKTDANWPTKIAHGLNFLNRTHLKCWYFAPIVVACADCLRLTRRKLQYSTVQYSNVIVQLFLYVGSGFGFYCSIISGSGWSHATFTLLPLLCLFGAYFIDYFTKNIHSKMFSTTTIRLALIALFLSVGVNAFASLPQSLTSPARQFDYNQITAVQIANYITSNLESGEQITIYSNTCSLGAILQNVMPTHWIDKYMMVSHKDPLYEVNKPEYTKVLTQNHRFFVCDDGSSWQVRIGDYIEANYNKVMTLGKYTLYQLKGGNKS